MAREKNPITILATKDEYEIYGDNSRRSRYLYTLFESLGGLSSEVPPGVYHFNAVKKLWRKPVVTLTKVYD